MAAQILRRARFAAIRSGAKCRPSEEDALSAQKGLPGALSGEAVVKAVVRAAIRSSRSGVEAGTPVRGRLPTLEASARSPDGGREVPPAAARLAEADARSALALAESRCWWILLKRSRTLSAYCLRFSDAWVKVSSLSLSQTSE
jgi:hypothetical protein